MTQRDLELMLREAGLLARERDFFLFGSHLVVEAKSGRRPKRER